MNRKTVDRRSAILRRLERARSASVAELVKEFGLSEVSIRKDLVALEAQGAITRRYGGAVINSNFKSQPEAPEAIASIAKAALALIPPNSRLIIDSGRTTAALLPLLKGRRDLVVMTNSLETAHLIAAWESGPTLLVTGGTWDAASRSLQGQIAEQMLRAYDFDLLFTGADGLDMDRGTTTFNELTGVSRVMAQVAKRVVVMAESRKFERKIHNLELSWAEVAVLVTDGPLTKHQSSRLAAESVEVLTTSG